MKKSLYKLMLTILKSLVLFKRILVKFALFLVKIFSKIGSIYQKHLAFYIYKLIFSCKKILHKLKIPWDSRIVEFFGKRGTLQLVLFIVALFAMYPHSAIYSQDTASVPGRNTVLYSLVGPGEQDFEIEEIVIDVTAQGPKDTRNWRTGAVVSDFPNAAGSEIAYEPQDISGISVGGSAVTKPSILPGSEIITAPDNTAVAKRNSTINHEVQPGEVLGSIAQKYGVNINTILWANDLTYRSYIRPGDTLVILPVDGLQHTVKSGETVAKIARTYGTEEKQIIEFNKLKNDGSNISVGESLVIPGGEKRSSQTYTAPAPSSVTKRVAQTFNSITAPTPSVNIPAGSGYLWPTTVRRITQYYGWRHTGVDIAGPIGTPLIASRAGRVIRSQCGWNGGYGCYVILDHGGGVHTLYAHASRLLVSVNQRVSQGQTVALMGSTGRSTGPHIHFEVRVNGRHQNPLSYAR